MSNSLKPVAIRLVKGSLIGLSVVAGLTILVLTVLTAAFTITAEKALEVSQDFEWEEIPATILDSRVLAPVDGGELDYCETIPSTVFCEESGTSYQPEQPKPAPQALVIPKNTPKSKLRKMVTEQGLTAPFDATKAQLLKVLQTA